MGARKVPSGPVTVSRAVRRRSTGSTILETALALPVLVTILLAIFDLSYVFYVKSSLQHGVREAGRLAQTGQTLSKDDGTGKKTPMTRGDSIVAMIQQQGGIAVKSSDVTISTVEPDGTTIPGPGGPGDVVSIRVKYQVALLTPILGSVFAGKKYQVDVGTSLRNEEF